MKKTTIKILSLCITVILIVATLPLAISAETEVWSPRGFKHVCSKRRHYYLA